MEELLPVLQAHLLDNSGRALLDQIAEQEEVVSIPLEDAPIDSSLHVLEVHLPGGGDPLLYYAEPQGPPTEHGFPLRLRAFRTPQARSPADRPPPSTRGFSDEEPATVRSMRPVAMPVVKSAHAAELVPPASRPPASSQSRDDFIGKAIGGGKYEVLEKLGEGAVGRVYRARHRELRKIVALKVLHRSFQHDPEFCQRFYGEALAASRLDHPNIMRVLDFGQEPDGLLYLAMEYLAGPSLDKVLEKDGTLPLERIVALMMQICGGLSHAHEHGLIHRDIKPENIMLVSGQDDDGNPVDIAKVCDFGIAARKRVERTKRDSLPEQEQGQVAGTPAYMSPEQCKGLALDERSDVYSSGVMLFEMATGRLPFSAGNMFALMAHHAETPPPRPSALRPDIDPLLETIILKALKKDPAERQQNMRQLRSELKELLEPVLLADAGAVRREVLDTGPRLDDAESGFAEFFIAFAGAVSKTGYYERGHPEAGVALARLYKAVNTTLAHRGELSFARRDVGDSVTFSVLSGIGEVYELKKLLPGAVLTIHAPKLGDVFVRRNIVALTLRDGIDERELGELIDILSGPEISADEIQAEFAKRNLVSANVLFASDLLGRDRKLPWQIDISMSRLARDLRSLPMMRKMGVERLRQVRLQLIGDVVRSLRKIEHVEILLLNTDLVLQEVEGLPEYDNIDLLSAFIEAIAPQKLGQVAAALAVHPLDKVKPMLQRVAALLAQNRSPDADVVLRDLAQKGVISIQELPAEVQADMHAEKQADLLAKNPRALLEPYSQVTDKKKFLALTLTLEKALKVLARRGDTATVLQATQTLTRIAKKTAPGSETREELAARALLVLADPAVLEPIADAYLTGPPERRDDVKTLLLMFGGPAAHALYASRMKLGPDAAPRARFVAAMRELGVHAGAVVRSGVLRLDQGESSGDKPKIDPEVLEDLLRCVPDKEDDELGHVVSQVIRQPHAGVCRAAVGALTSCWGQRARALILAVLVNEDDGVRLAALASLRKLQAITEPVVGRIDRMLSRGVPAGEELRAAAAAALGEAQPSARAQALGVLRKVLFPQRTSMFLKLKDALSGEAESTAVVVAAARAAVLVGGAEGRAMVQERANKAEAALAAQLKEALRVVST